MCAERLGKVHERHSDIHLELKGHIAIVELRRPPHNYFDVGLLAGLADIYEELDRDHQCRSIVLTSAGNTFCAGADHSKSTSESASVPVQAAMSTVSREAIRLFRTQKPVVAAIQGAAVGGGLGLALSADFRITCPSARFWANFSLLGFHAGFGLTETLPRLVGSQRASRLLYTAQQVNGEEAHALGLADVLMKREEVYVGAVALAEEIARSSPLAVRSMRYSLRRGFADKVEIAMERELMEQTWQRQSEDYKEGIRAMAERRYPLFIGQ